MHNLSPLSFVTAIVISTPIAISQQASVNPTLRFMMSHNPTVPTKIINQKIDEPVTYLPVIVRLTSPNQTLPSFATELHRRGTIAIVTVPRDRLSELQGASGVRRLESRLCVTPALDHARTFCSLPEVLNQTTATGAALNGKDVVVGFCDIGCDTLHIVDLVAACQNSCHVSGMKFLCIIGGPFYYHFRLIKHHWSG